MSENSTAPMFVSVFINSSGLEELANGKQPWYWDFFVRAHNEDGSLADVPGGCALVASNVQLSLPSRDDAAQEAVAALQMKLRRVYAEAEQEATEIKSRIGNLLAIGHTPAA